MGVTSGEAMRVTVVIKGEEKFASMEGDDTVEDLCDRVKMSRRQWLEDENGKKLDDKATLASCGVVQGSKLSCKPEPLTAAQRDAKQKDRSSSFRAGGGSLKEKEEAAQAALRAPLPESKYKKQLREQREATQRMTDAQFNGVKSDVKNIAKGGAMQPAQGSQNARRQAAAEKLEAMENKTAAKTSQAKPGSRRAQIIAEMEAEKAKEAAADKAIEDRARSLGVIPGKTSECMCGYSNFGWQAMLAHFDRSRGPHRIRAAGDDTPWDGPVEVVPDRPEAGPAPGCTMEQQRLAAQHRGKRMDLVFAGMKMPEDDPSPCASGGLGNVDLTEVNAETGEARDFGAAGEESAAGGNVNPPKGPKQPSEVIPGLMWQAGRKDCGDHEMRDIPNGCFTHSVYGLNHSPCATPFACEESFFIDLADQLGAFIQPYFVPVCEWIDQKRKETRNCRVVVHCQHGQSRSGAIVVAYVMWTLKKSLKDAVKMVQTARPLLRMNVAFLSQLQAFEQDLFGLHSPSISLEQLDKMDVCKCYFAINEIPCEVARGKKKCPPWTPSPSALARSKSK